MASNSIMKTMVSCFLLACAIQSPILVALAQPAFATVAIGSLFPPASSGYWPPKVPCDGKGCLPIVFRDGPCANVANVSDVARLDRLRVRSIQYALYKFTAPSTWIGNPWALLDMDAMLSPLPYTVTIGLGTPAAYKRVVFDTAAYLNWLTCQAYIFDPIASTSYRLVACTEATCANLREKLYCAAGGSCPYGKAFMPGYAGGVLSRDTITISSTACDGFVFGCSAPAATSVAGIAGVLGLANFAYSAPNQLSQYFGVGFHYCLPIHTCATGHLTFGPYAGGVPVAYTPMLRNGSPLYYVTMTGITVGGQTLAVAPSEFSVPGTIVDSGTAFTYLPRSAYAALRDAFQRAMAGYKLLPAVAGEVLDTCYDLTGAASVSVPTIGLVLDGATVQVDAAGTLYAYSYSKVCLAFAEQTEAGVPFIIGYTQQKGLEVVYDLANSMIGFGVGGC